MGYHTTTRGIRLYKTNRLKYYIATQYLWRVIYWATKLRDNWAGYNS